MTDCAIEFPGMVEKYYHSWFRFHPFEALHAGLEASNNLPPISDEDQGALAALFLKVRCCMEENGSDRLTEAQQVDFQLMRNSVQYEHRCLLQADWRQQNPLKYLPNQTLQQLICEHKGHETTLVQRLSALPQYLNEAKQQLSHKPQLIPTFWQQQGISHSEQEALRLSQLAQTDVGTELKESAIKASAALTDFAAYLTQLTQCTGQFSEGDSFFQLSLSLRYFIDIDTQKIASLLSEHIKATQQTLPSEVAAMMSTQLKGSSDTAFQSTVQQCNSLYQKLVKKNIFPLPDDAQLRISKMPDYLASTSPLCLYQHLVNDDQQGLLLIQPNTSLHPAMVECLCATKLWPGEHGYTVLTYDSAEKSIPRLLNTSPAFSLSWTLYCLEVLIEEKIFEQSESTIIAKQIIHQYAKLAQIDLQLHQESLSIEQAKDQIASLNLPKIEQNTLIVRITQYPGEMTAAVLGYKILQQLKTDVAGQGINKLYEFHQQLLSQGPIALPLLIQTLWGKATWESIQQRLFG